MATTVLLELHIQPGKTTDFLAYIRSIIADTRKFAGFQEIRICQNDEDKNCLVFVEKWDSRQAYEKYFDWRTSTGVVAKLGEYVAAAPSKRFFDDTGI